MIDLSATGLGTWLQIVSAFAAVQFVASALKNFRAARRLVPIGSVTPTMVEKYKTVPVCFAGSENRLTRTILWAYSRLWLGRKAKKQAFVCDNVVFLDEDGAALVRDRPLSAGQRVRIRVAVGESDSHVYRSAKRSAVGNELLLAVAFRRSDMTEYEEYVRCISVRARCRRVPEEGADVPKSLLEWQVMDPAGIGDRTDSRLAWSEVPQSALWLFSREVCDDKNGRVLPSDRLELPGLGIVYAYGSTKWKGLGSLCVKIVNCVLALRIASIVDSALADGSTDSVRAYPLTSVLMLLLLSKVTISVLPRRFKIGVPVMQEATKLPSIFLPNTVERKLLWHGSTRRSLALGNNIRRAELWRQLRFDYWEPFWQWIQLWFRRLPSIGKFGSR